MKSLPDRVYPWIATFFGAGLSPVTPGTCGSLAALPLYLILRRLSLKAYLAILTLMSLVGIMAADRAEEAWGKDPGRVVIDEVVGMLLTLVSRPKGVRPILAGFLIFRALDILKPPPVGTLDQNVPGGLGIMVDDMAAGLMGALILKLLGPQVNKVWMRRS